MVEVLGYVGLALIPAFILLDAFRGQRQYARQRAWRIRGILITAAAVWLSIVIATAWANLLGEYTLFDLSGLGAVLGAIVLIRTIIAFSLSWELRDGAPSTAA